MAQINTEMLSTNLSHPSEFVWGSQCSDSVVAGTPFQTRLSSVCNKWISQTFTTFIIILFIPFTFLLLFYYHCSVKFWLLKSSQYNTCRTLHLCNTVLTNVLQFKRFSSKFTFPGKYFPAENKRHFLSNHKQSPVHTKHRAALTVDSHLLLGFITFYIINTIYCA